MNRRTALVTGLTDEEVVQSILDRGGKAVQGFDRRLRPVTD
jgi:hypothetical protein